ncbi:alanine transaminase alt2 [Gnomoniopsis smithogilvyi]|uniref:Alanine transaminase alt2 n=1 Tax=Gnomoniopsis smithogilvyi TaxID=1191159 RepID=A0A9W8Z4F9_9PEZI|nr:alanine transaminase alt2 [Gnomoniopsis smithogilvyi]
MTLLILLLAFGLHLLALRTFIILPFQQSRKSRALGCGTVPVEPTRWPLGLDMVRAGLEADRDQRTPEFVTDRFHAMGRYTFRISILGTSNLITAEPKNVQAILASQFNEFVMGRARKTNLKLILGRSIFAVDGAAWHSARETVRPLFARDNIANLEMLEGHFQTLLACIEKPGLDSECWTKPVALAGLFPRLTLDSATELFLGHSAHSLQSRLKGEPTKHNFDSAFEEVLSLLSVRMRLRSLYWLYGNRKLKQCMTVLNAFVDDAIRAADTDAGSKRSRYDFLNVLRERCKDQAEVREQFLGMLAAGRDTTASLMSWVFYCLVRNPRVFSKLRAIVIQEFGTYDADPAVTRRDITFQKLKGCRYLQLVMSETLRLHSIVAFNSRMAVKDTTLPTGGGEDGTEPVFVAAGTEVNFSSHIMHRRKDLWGQDADKFVPERWETSRPGWAYAPFNGGPRICIGQQFALTEAGYVIVRLLQRFDAIEGMDVDHRRDYHHFTITSSPGTPYKGDEAVKCRLRVAAD